jgi:heme o synthase
VKQIVVYSLALTALTLLPFALGELGAAYLAAALALDCVFVALAVRLRRRPARRTAAVLFHYSLLYLALLFVAAAVDPLL